MGAATYRFGLTSDESADFARRHSNLRRVLRGAHSLATCKASGLSALQIAPERQVDTVQANRNKARIICRCGHEWDTGVLVGREVPEALQCPSGERITGSRSSRSDICRPRCKDMLLSAVAELRDCIENKLRTGREVHVRAGTVVVDFQ